jgi:hypothetical protein
VNQGTSSQARPPRRQRPHGAVGNPADQETGGADPTEKTRKPRQQRKPPSGDGDKADGVLAPPKREGGRRANFGASQTPPNLIQPIPTNPRETVRPHFGILMTSSLRLESKKRLRVGKLIIRAEKCGVSGDMQAQPPGVCAVE